MPLCAGINILDSGGTELSSEITLLDTGNNFKSLISREILETNKISYLPVKLSALSVDLKKVNIVGRINLKFKFAGSDTEFQEIF